VVLPDDVAWTPDALGRSGTSGDVRVRWLGTAGFAIEHDGCRVLIDPYVTRASLLRCVAGRLRPDPEAIRRFTPAADAIIVGHTHFDHALDVPTIALRTGARVFGSRSAAALCRASGVPEALVEVVERAPGAEPVVREIGPFRLRFLPSAHSPLLLGRVPFPGEIADCDHVPTRPTRFRCGAVFGVEIRVAGRTLYHVGSAEIVEANLDATARNVDLLLLCAAGWSASRKFPERIAHRLAPGAILLSHWDDFLRPIESPARALPAIQLSRLVDRLTRAATGIRVGTLPILGHVWA
jgi:L-ascorbate metabolism protein UlaG (beta-lactamase superfamily)